MSRVRWWLVCLGWVAASAAAQAAWFTVTGNPQDPSVDTVQVDPVAMGGTGERRIMSVRVSRAQERLNWESEPYRSYEAQVVFDCRGRKADYRVVSFYRAPLWNGPVHKTTDYSGNPRPMRLLDVEPNPTTRIIRAACHAAA